MKCVVCHKGPQDGVTIHRINAKGQPGLWACARHYGQTDGPPIDPDVQTIVTAIERAGK
jgi:hypothetical protein